MESLFGSRQPSRKTPRTGGGSDDEGPTLREVLKHLEDMEAKAEAREARMEARMAALGAALSEHFEQQVLPAFRASVLRDVDERMQGYHAAFQDKMARMAETTEHHDRAARAANLVVHGLPEQTQENPVARATGLFPESDGPPAPVLNARRLGAPGLPGRSRPRPMLIHFQSVTAKHAALKRSKVLRGRQVYLDVDLTPAQQAARTALRPQFGAAKASGHQPYWRAERLFVRANGRVDEVFPGPRPPPGAPGPGAARSSGRARAPGTGPPRGTGAPPGTAPPSDEAGPSGTGPGSVPMAEA